MKNKELINPDINTFNGKVSLLKIFSLLTDNSSKELIIREVFVRLVIEESFEKLDLNKTAFLESLLEKKELLLVEFFKNLSIDLNNKEQVDRFLKKTDQTLEEIFERVTYQEKLKLLKRSLFSKTKVKEFFAENQSAYQKVNIFIFIFEERSLGEELRRIVIEDNLDFENFVEEIVKSEKIQAGFKSTGLVNINSLNSKIIKQVKKTKTQDFSEVFELEDNKYSMIKVIDRQIPEITEKIREEIQESLFKNWLNKQIRITNPKLIRDKTN